MGLMRILLIHNRYQQRGGEDAVFEAEAALLARFGHDVACLTFTNDDIADHRSAIGSLQLAASTIWSRGSADRVRQSIREHQPDVVHFHNTFPLVSPSAYSACKAEGVAVVQTLHNYRLLCPSGVFFRDNQPCEDCLGRRVPWPGVQHGCYRASRSQTVVVAGMITIHGLRRTWERDVDIYIALTQFARRKFVEGGIPEDRIRVVPNAVEPDPGIGQRGGSYFLFVGRLTHDKGIDVLLQAWTEHAVPAPLHIAGDGPLVDMVVQAARENRSVRYLGRLPRRDILAQMHGAIALVFPSVWYEGFPVTIAEASACGLPTIASRLGAMSEIVKDGETGLLFEPFDATDLAAKATAVWEDLEQNRMMAAEARRFYERELTGEHHHRQLIAAYEHAIFAHHNGVDAQR